jgi:hypothetical protein
MPARPLRPLDPALLAVGAALLAYAGCSTDSGSATGVTHPTMIEIAPEQFRGDVPCAADGDEPGLKRYVATLLDPNEASGGAGSGAEAEAGGAANAAADDFALPSSAPTSCLAGIGFGFIVPGRHYVARIQGYDRADIESRAPGSPLVVSLDGAPVEPRWSAECDATLAVDETIVRAKRCTQFTASDADALGSLRVRVPALLGDLQCGSAPGEVEQLEVSVDVGGEPLVQTIGCDEGDALFDGLAPYLPVTAYVAAYSAGSTEPIAGASCSARSLPEATVVAQCTALSQEGTLRVDLPAALELLGLDCDDVSDVRVQALGQDEAQSFPPPACRQSFDRGFVAGSASVTVTVVHADSSESGAPSVVETVTCFGQVTPGRIVVADCELPE